MKQEVLNKLSTVATLAGILGPSATAVKFIRIIFKGEGRPGTVWLVAAVIIMLIFIFLVSYYCLNIKTRYLSCIEKFCKKNSKNNWSGSKHSYKYAGVTGNTIKEDFLEYLSRLPEHDTRKFELLFIHPESSFFKMQELHKHGYSSENGNIPAEVQKEIDEAVKSMPGIVNNTVRELKKTTAYKQGRIDIRYYDEYLHCYLEVIDDKRIIIGLLHKGCTGYKDAAIILNKYKVRRPFRRENITMYDTYMDVWDRLWENGVRAD